MGAIITKDEAIKLGLKSYFTGKPCKHGHTAERIVSSSTCRECSRVSSRKSSTYDPIARRKDYLENREQILLDKAAQRARQREHFAANPMEGIVHRAKINHKQTLTRLKKNGLVPPNIDEEKIYQKYLECQIKIHSTGNAYEVDHIKPIADGGLHTHDNLRVITRVDNVRRQRKQL